MNDWKQLRVAEELESECRYWLEERKLSHTAESIAIMVIGKRLCGILEDFDHQICLGIDHSSICDLLSCLEKKQS